MNTYTHYIRRWCPVAAAAALIVCFGCSDDFGKMNGNGYETFPSDCLVFTTRLDPGSLTSGTRNTAGNLEIAEEEWTLDLMPKDSIPTRGTLTGYLSGEAGVLGFQYDEENNKTPIAGDDNNLDFVFNGDMLVPKGASIPWKTIDKRHLNIYAYAPYVKTGENSYGMTLDFTSAPPWIDYTVPDAIADQKDILVASWKSTEHTDQEYKGKTIPLEFNHILTAIRFKVGFECKVKSIEITGVKKSGRYNFLTGLWDTLSQTGQTTQSDPSGQPAQSDSPTTPDLSSYKIEFTDLSVHPDGYLEIDKNTFLTGDESSDNDYLILMPQTLPANAQIILTCVNDNAGTTTGSEVTAENGNTEVTSADKIYTANIGGQVWGAGKLITYTLYENSTPDVIYFDLAAGNVTINASSYNGYVYKTKNEQGEWIPTPISGDHKYGNHYYVYQSCHTTEDNRAAIWKDGVCTPPKYERVTFNGRQWSEYITDNTDIDKITGISNGRTVNKKVNKIIESWKSATASNRRGTKHRIEITGNVTCNLTIDNIYSTYQDYSTSRTTAGISFVPTGTNAKVTIDIVGDNRIGAVHYFNKKGENKNEIIFEGTGSLTVADVEAHTDGIYKANHWNAAIGANDVDYKGESNGIVINSGVIFAGTTYEDNCTAIGGGGNEYGNVTINGGSVMAIAATSGATIGGGIGYNVHGGLGDVKITGGNVYAYNFENEWKLPSSAIGGGGSVNATAEGQSTVTIEGGYVYAVSETGTAIGGGSSYKKKGGDASITITGGEVFAKTRKNGSASIGGGLSYTEGLKEDGSKKPSDGYNGGDATITIYGNPVIHTGSIGGGGTGDSNGKLGNATISISGNADIQAQFILEAGTTGTPTFTMSGGKIRNSDTSDTDYKHVKEDGGAVWLQNGKVTISDGTIENCKAKRGGAIYIAGVTDSKSEAKSKATFTMTGGTIQNNEAVRGNYTGIHEDSDTDDSVNDFAGSGGAIYLIDGTVNLNGGTISGNLAAGGHGGGVFIRRGNLTVDGATISDNATEVRRTNFEADPTKKTGTYAGGNGGGVYVYSKKSDVNVNLISGTISGNTADRRGGGLCVIQESDKNAKISIGTEGGNVNGLTISWNHSLLTGGGLYARGANADITINSGTIQNNTVSQYVHNPNVTNEQGSVTLNGKFDADGKYNVNVTHNIVTFNPNYGSDPKPSTQRIVTETNSRLKAPAFTRTGYRLIGWNSKPSGSGEWYYNDQIMNISKDITLYAQWEFGGN